MVSKYLLDSTVTAEFELGLPYEYPAFDSLCGAQMAVAKRVLAFNSLCEAQTPVGERLKY